MSKTTKDTSTRQLYEFDKPLLVASYFGFIPIESPKVKEEDKTITEDCEPHPHYNAAEKAAFIRTYVERDFSTLTHPLAVSYKVGSSRKGSRYALELVGFNDGVAEALLIRTALSILVETGRKHLVVDINCVGDKESMASYERELQNFVKRSSAELPDEVKKELKQDVYNILKSSSPEAVTLRQSMPPTIAHLSTPSRNYFKEVLEHIESLEVEFRLNPELVGHKNFCSHTIFAIKNSESEAEETLAVGYCYHRLSKRFGFKKEIPLAGANIFLHQEEKKAKTVQKTYKGSKPKFYLVQLGREAKMRSLSIIEILRRERIAVHHVLAKDKLTVQLTNAESLGVPYLIIIGHREALDGTATVRNISTRSQETIHLRDLPGFLKNIPI